MKGYRITYEIVLDIYVEDNENRDKATEIGDELISNGEFESVPVKVEELEGGPYEQSNSAPNLRNLQVKQ